MLRPIPLHHRRLGSGVLCVHARTLRIWERADLELISGKCEACMGFSIHRTDCTEAHTPHRSERTPNCESTQSVHSFAGIVKSCPLHPHDCRRHCAHLQLTAWYNKSSGGPRNTVSRARERERKRERETPLLRNHSRSCFLIAGRVRPLLHLQGIYQPIPARPRTYPRQHLRPAILVRSVLSCSLYLPRCTAETKSRQASIDSNQLPV